MKLLPCPFCGAVPDEGTELDYPGIEHDKDCYLYDEAGNFVYDLDNGDKWNHRTATKPL